MIRGAACLAAGAAICILLNVDGVITKIAAASPDALLSGIARFEAFGHGIGTLLIVVTACIVGGLNRKQQGLLLLSAFGSGILASLVKVFFVRPRPFLYLSGKADVLLSTVFHDGTFSGFVEHLGNSHLQSFPSAHTAAAFGLAAALGKVAPQGCWWWLFLASGCGLQRLSAQKHFASDVLFGAAIGLFCGQLLAWQMSQRSVGPSGRDVLPIEERLKFGNQRAA
ncbi:MAG: phosphatase PAP2 family protein [Planctomycetaceae bacterium]